MHPHIKALRQSLAELGIPYAELPGFRDAVMVGRQAFIRSATPFNPESVSDLCRDKDAAYKVLGGALLVPRTKSFLDPGGRHPELVKERSIDEIVRATLDFLYPRVVKMNRGEGGKNVFIVQSESEMREALSRIFDRSSRDYDYIALIQEYIEPACEYRVAIAGGKPVFAYARKVFEPIEGRELDERFADCGKILEALGMSWGSLDFIETRDGRLYFLEANTRPMYEGFVAARGDARLRELYKAALSSFHVCGTARHISTGSYSRGSDSARP